MKKKWILATILGMIVLIILCIGGKKYMDKKAVEKSYQDGVELIQNYLTDYLIKNYEGIEKIEWQGVGVEWRNSDIFGSSILGNYVNSNVHVYISKDNYFTMRLRLNDRAEYDVNQKKYVLSESMNPSNMDTMVKTGIHNAIYSYSDDPDNKKINVNQKEKQELDNIKKSSIGSPNAQVIYNLEIHELNY
ncbi:hypothetical protein [Enterococcus sp. S23]|uniref:hypothetical protein n=1 Tax=unclassified Enterococcus TaxID=2608891 RepID=UPI00399B4C7E|nr:hypothetical protein [Enterococcus sp. S23]MCA5016965.1 hypothetical protein [Enterococcus sp. S22(2020)]